MVNSFPVLDTDQLVLVAEGGQIIRVPVAGISIVGRASRGVTVFNVGEDDHVVSVTRLREDEHGEEGDEDEENGENGAEEEAVTGDAGEDEENGSGTETGSGPSGDTPEGKQEND